MTLRLTPGATVSEGELSNLTGFGRTPVREALKLLERDHLVRIIQRHGVQITEMNFEQQLLLLETRRVLERLIATRAARRRTEAEAQEALRIAGRLDAAGGSNAFDTFMHAHMEATALMKAAARNPYATTAIAPCHAISRRFYFLHYRQARDLVLASSHHARVMRAIAAADEAAADEAVQGVMDYVEGFTRSALLDRT